MDAEEIVNVIDQAFATHRYDSRIDQLLRVETHWAESREARQAFLGKEWREIDPEVFERQFADAFLIGAELIAFYLPAFLIAAIRSKYDGVARQLLGFCLRPPKKPALVARFYAQYRDLTTAQRDAVAATLSYFARVKCAGDERFKRQVADAMERYWNVRA